MENKEAAAPPQTFVQTAVAYLGAQKWIIYGGLSGCISRTATAPLERLKVLNQVQHMDKSGPRYVGLIPAMSRIMREEGFAAFWKGNFTNIVRIIPSDATRFYTYDIFKSFIAKMKPEGEKLTPVECAVAGGLAGMTSTVATYPLDLVRTRLTVQTLATSDSQLLAARYRGILHCLYRIGKEEGITSLYKGMWVSMMGVAPYVAINFSVYETLKHKASEHGWISGGSTISGVVMGAVSGTTAVTLTYPTDVLRRRMMMDGIGDTKREYSGLVDAIVKMAKHEGVPGFFRGLVPCYLKVVPATAISWGTIETLRKFVG
jgi:solute carrier family 25 phosphate transporter 23/24/25/41